MSHVGDTFDSVFYALAASFCLNAHIDASVDLVPELDFGGEEENTGSTHKERPALTADNGAKIGMNPCACKTSGRTVLRTRKGAQAARFHNTIHAFTPPSHSFQLSPAFLEFFSLTRSFLSSSFDLQRYTFTGLTRIHSTAVVRHPYQRLRFLSGHHASSNEGESRN